VVLDIHTGIDIAARIAACGFVLSALELLSIQHAFATTGVFGIGAVSSFHSRIAALRLADRWLIPLLVAQLTAFVALAIAGPFSYVGRAALVIGFFSALAVRWRRYSGGDGAEQMGMLIFASIGIAVLPWPSEGRMLAATTFIAAQLSLSYVAAGIAKLVSPVWRSGEALPAILSTSNHGHPLAARFANKYPLLSLFGCWSVILFECTFPILLFGPDWLIVAALGIGLMFHLGCAVLMGLNSFVWSFPAAYPCVIAAIIYWIR
jgi:hypothetical protein